MRISISIDIRTVEKAIAKVVRFLKRKFRRKR